MSRPWNSAVTERLARRRLPPPSTPYTPYRDFPVHQRYPPYCYTPASNTRITRRVNPLSSISLSTWSLTTPYSLLRTPSLGKFSHSCTGSIVKDVFVCTLKHISRIRGFLDDSALTPHISFFVIQKTRKNHSFPTPYIFRFLSFLWVLPLCRCHAWLYNSVSVQSLTTRL